MNLTADACPRFWQAPAMPAYAQFAAAIPATISNDWLRPTLRAVARFRSLPENWDGYGSSPIKLEADRSTLSFLQTIGNCSLVKPEVFPVAGGGLGMLFQSNDRELQIEVLPNGMIRFEKDKQDEPFQDGPEWSGVFGRYDESVAWQLISWLMRR